MPAAGSPQRWMRERARLQLGTDALYPFYERTERLRLDRLRRVRSVLGEKKMVGGGARGPSHGHGSEHSSSSSRVRLRLRGAAPVRRDEGLLGSTLTSLYAKDNLTLSPVSSVAAEGGNTLCQAEIALPEWAQGIDFGSFLEGGAKARRRGVGSQLESFGSYPDFSVPLDEEDKTGKLTGQEGIRVEECQHRAPPCGSPSALDLIEPLQKWSMKDNLEGEHAPRARRRIRRRATETTRPKLTRIAPPGSTTLHEQQPSSTTIRASHLLGSPQDQHQRQYLQQQQQHGRGGSKMARGARRIPRPAPALRGTEELGSRRRPTEGRSAKPNEPNQPNDTNLAAWVACGTEHRGDVGLKASRIALRREPQKKGPRKGKEKGIEGGRVGPSIAREELRAKESVPTKSEEKEDSYSEDSDFEKE